jgi:hypothetical protein
MPPYPIRFTTGTRLLHTSARSCINYVGPPDPVSNMRPVIYDDHPTSTKLGHPYSLREFTSDTQDRNLQWRLHRQQLDAFDHQFWTDSNTRFEAAKQIALSRVPESSPPIAREHALSEFYREWLLQEARRQQVYTVEWRKRNFEAIALAARVEWRDFQTRIKSWLTFNKDR